MTEFLFATRSRNTVLCERESNRSIYFICDCLMNQVLEQDRRDNNEYHPKINKLSFIQNIIVVNKQV